MGKRVFIPQVVSKDKRIVTFLDFIQVLAIRTIRQYYDIPLGKIRDGVVFAQRKFGISHLFAHKVNCYVLGKEMYVEFPSKERITIQISGKQKGQLAMPEVIQLYSEKLSFSDGGLVTRFTPFTYKHYEVIMDPKVRFGQPFSNASGHTVATLLNASKTEGSIDAAAKVFGVQKTDVQMAIEYERYLRGQNAA
ncbi:MAG: hypothetical protein KIS92_15340 [Planctomycetota bacterium]|nr:hypothetical protein [Planctomycetota bacterium]